MTTQQQQATTIETICLWGFIILMCTGFFHSCGSSGVDGAEAKAWKALEPLAIEVRSWSVTGQSENEVTMNSAIAGFLTGYDTQNLGQALASLGTLSATLSQSAPETEGVLAFFSPAQSVPDEAKIRFASYLAPVNEVLPELSHSQDTYYWACMVHVPCSGSMGKWSGQPKAAKVPVPAPFSIAHQ